MNNKSLMFQKSTNYILGWIVEKIGDIPGTVAPSFGSCLADYCRFQFIIPGVLPGSSFGRFSLVQSIRFGSIGLQGSFWHSREVIE